MNFRPDPVRNVALSLPLNSPAARLGRVIQQGLAAEWKAIR